MLSTWEKQRESRRGISNLPESYICYGVKNLIQKVAQNSILSYGTVRSKHNQQYIPITEPIQTEIYLFKAAFHGLVNKQRHWPHQVANKNKITFCLDVQSNDVVGVIALNTKLLLRSPLKQTNLHASSKLRARRFLHRQQGPLRGSSSPLRHFELIPFKALWDHPFELIRFEALWAHLLWGTLSSSPLRHFEIIPFEALWAHPLWDHPLWGTLSSSPLRHFELIPFEALRWWGLNPTKLAYNPYCPDGQHL